MPANAISEQRKHNLQQLAERLKVEWTKLALLDQATTHSSYASQQAQGQDFERLEFFGDAVLKFVVAEYLFEEFSELDEGQLTEISAVLVSARTLESVGRQVELSECILVGRGVAMRGSIIAKSMEAVIGALYLDSQFRHVRELICRLICVQASELSKDSVKANYKAQLQQWTQARAKGIPVYNVLTVSGPPHEPVFDVQVCVGEEIIASGSGRSKKAAEQEAARAAMDKLQSPSL